MRISFQVLRKESGKTNAIIKWKSLPEYQLAMLFSRQCRILVIRAKLLCLSYVSQRCRNNDFVKSKCVTFNPIQQPLFGLKSAITDIEYTWWNVVNQPKRGGYAFRRHIRQDRHIPIVTADESGDLHSYIVSLWPRHHFTTPELRETRRQECPSWPARVRLMCSASDTNSGR